MSSPSDRRRFPLSKVPLCSSVEIVRAIERLGAYRGKKKRGTHAEYCRVTDDGRLIESAVLVGYREVARGTLKGILERLEIDLQDFLKAL